MQRVIKQIQCIQRQECMHHVIHPPKSTLSFNNLIRQRTGSVLYKYNETGIKGGGRVCIQIATNITDFWETENPYGAGIYYGFDIRSEIMKFKKTYGIGSTNPMTYNSSAQVHLFI